jgi:hypothetical protein
LVNSNQAYRLATFVIENKIENVLPVDEFLQKHRIKIIDLIENCLDEHEAIKVCFEMFLQYLLI